MLLDRFMAPRVNKQPRKFIPKVYYEVMSLLQMLLSRCVSLIVHVLSWNLIPWLGSFLGHIPGESIIHIQIQQTWHEIKVDFIQNLTKGFFLFYFANPSQARAVVSYGPWSIHSSLLVFQPWTKSFFVTNQVSLRVLIWVEFLGLPFPLWS